jgi:trimethylamine-N-oxide reductase (cytochrome c)
VADHGMYGPWEQIRDNGCKFISINPQKTASDAYLNAEWVKIIPNTDVALFLGMANHVLASGLEDKDYLAKYTTGSDKWIAYVKGEGEDKTAKTPEWAAGITGIDAAKIRELAELPLSVRGYGMVKDASAEQAAERRRWLLDAIRKGGAPMAQAAE